MTVLVFLGWVAIAFTAAVFANALIDTVRISIWFECLTCSKRFKIRAVDAWRFKRDGCPDCNTITQENP